MLDKYDTVTLTRWYFEKTLIVFLGIYCYKHNIIDIVAIIIVIIVVDKTNTNNRKSSTAYFIHDCFGHNTFLILISYGSKYYNFQTKLTISVLNILGELARRCLFLLVL